MLNKSKVNGIVVRHIPFTDPSQLYSIYKVSHIIIIIIILI